MFLIRDHRLACHSNAYSGSYGSQYKLCRIPRDVRATTKVNVIQRSEGSHVLHITVHGEGCPGTVADEKLNLF